MNKWLKDKIEKVTGSDDDAMSEGGQVSSGPSSFGDSETSGGGADAVPGTPDATPSVDLGEGRTQRTAGAS
jgi:hypothetical protein